MYSKWFAICCITLAVSSGKKESVRVMRALCSSSKGICGEGQASQSLLDDLIRTNEGWVGVVGGVVGL